MPCSLKEHFVKALRGYKMLHCIYVGTVVEGSYRVRGVADCLAAAL